MVCRRCKSNAAERTTARVTPTEQKMPRTDMNANWLNDRMKTEAPAAEIPTARATCVAWLPAVRRGRRVAKRGGGRGQKG